MYLSLLPPVEMLVSRAPTFKGAETSVTVSPEALVAVMVSVWSPCCSWLNFADLSSSHRSNQLSLQEAEQEKPPLPLTVTTTLLTPVG